MLLLSLLVLLPWLRVDDVLLLLLPWLLVRAVLLLLLVALVALNMLGSGLMPCALSSSSADSSSTSSYPTAHTADSHQIN